MISTMSTAPAEQGEVPSDTLPVRLYLARFLAGRLSAVEAASRVGVSDQTWRNWEQGQYLGGVKRKAMMRYVANQLGVDEDWLRDGGPLRPAPTPDGGRDNPRYADVLAFRQVMRESRLAPQATPFAPVTVAA